MKVNFGGTFTGEKTDGGNINLDAVSEGISERYVMLVPAGTGSKTLNFGGAYEGTATLENGIEANKFYRMPDGSAIAVKVEKVKPFTVGMDNGKPRRVEFSKGNLQYLGSSDGTGTWRFAEHQWDILGAGPSATSDKGNVDLSSLGYTAEQYNYGSAAAGGSETSDDMASARDLFGWGATGYQDTRDTASTHQTNYRPYSTSKTAASGTAATYNKYGYGPDYDGNAYGLSVAAKSDWGCLAIGADPAGTWRTLSSAEWAYLLNTGNAESGARTDANRFAKARVNDVNGMLIFPDGYNNNVRIPDGSIKGVAALNNKSAAYPTDDDIPTETWTSMETAGVVFLPAAGRRNGSSLYLVGSYGYYWSSTCSDSCEAYGMYFCSGKVNPQYSDYRYFGYSVRLVR